MRQTVILLFIVQLVIAKDLVFSVDTLNDLHYEDAVTFKNRSTFLINQSEDTIIVDSVTLDTNGLGYPIEELRFITGGYRFYIDNYLHTDTLDVGGWDEMCVFAPNDSFEIRLYGFDDGTAGFIMFIEELIDIVFVDLLFHYGDKEIRLTLSGFYHKFPDTGIHQTVTAPTLQSPSSTFNVKGQVLPTSNNKGVKAQNVGVGYKRKQIMKR